VSRLIISHILKKCINEGERTIILNVLVKYLCIRHYHKYKMKDIDLRVMKVILIRFIIEKT